MKHNTAMLLITTLIAGAAQAVGISKEAPWQYIEVDGSYQAVRVSSLAQTGIGIGCYSQGEKLTLSAEPISFHGEGRKAALVSLSVDGKKHLSNAKGQVEGDRAFVTNIPGSLVLALRKGNQVEYSVAGESETVPLKGSSKAISQLAAHCAMPKGWFIAKPRAAPERQAQAKTDASPESGSSKAGMILLGLILVIAAGFLVYVIHQNNQKAGLESLSTEELQKEADRRTSEDAQTAQPESPSTEELQRQAALRTIEDSDRARRKAKWDHHKKIGERALKAAFAIFIIVFIIGPCVKICAGS